MSKSIKSTMRFAFVSSISVMAGYIVLGCGFGILLASKGYSFIWAFSMSAAIYAGSMQYAAVELLVSEASLMTAALMTLMINVRHIFYGITMLERYKDTGKIKPYLIFALSDETFSLVCSPKLPENVNPQYYYFFVSLFNQCYWIIGSVIGSFIGNAINFSFIGIEFSMTALFVVIFVEQLENGNNHIPAVTGLISSVVCLALFGSSEFLIPSMIIITVLLLAEKPLLQRKN